MLHDSIRAIQWQGDHLVLLDQRLLPHEEVYLECRTAQDVARAIRDMVVRGAVFLASPAASFITGTNLIVDGALTQRVQF